MDVFYTCLFADTARGRLVRGFIDPEETSGNCPFSKEGMGISPDQQEGELFVRNGKDLYIHCHIRVFKLGRVIVLQVLLF